MMRLVVVAGKFQLHHAVHSMSKKPLGLFWQFRLSTSNYNNTRSISPIQGDMLLQYVILQPNTRSKYTS